MPADAVAHIFQRSGARTRVIAGPVPCLPPAGWEISENLHRAELTTLERDKLVAEWVELTGEVSSQVDTKLGRPESGARKAARDLGLEKMDVHRALKVASLSPEAQDVAREAGLDDNRTALLGARKLLTPDAQVVAVEIEQGDN